MNVERLEGIRADLAMARHFANSDIAVHAVERVEAALAAEVSVVPRECDVGTPVEQAERYRRFCNSFIRCDDCPLSRAASALDANVPCALAWAHTPHASAGPVGVRGPIGSTGAPREPHVGQEDAAAGVQGIMDTPRIEDPVTTVLGVDWGLPSDAGHCITASPAPTVTDSFELPF